MSHIKVLKTGFTVWVYLILASVAISISLTFILLMTGLISPEATMLTMLLWMLLLIPVQWYVLGWSSLRVLKPKVLKKK